MGRGVEGVERTFWERESAELIFIGLGLAPAALVEPVLAGACGATSNCFAIASCVDRAWFLACAAATAGGGVTAAGLYCSVTLGSLPPLDIVSIPYPGTQTLLDAIGTSISDTTPCPLSIAISSTVEAG